MNRILFSDANTHASRPHSTGVCIGGTRTTSKFTNQVKYTCMNTNGILRQIINNSSVAQEERSGYARGLLPSRLETFSEQTVQNLRSHAAHFETIS